jgi:hypothetical protein
MGLGQTKYSRLLFLGPMPNLILPQMQILKVKLIKKKNYKTGGGRGPPQFMHTT